MHGEREKPGWGDSPWGAKAGGACSTLLTCSSQLSAYVEACARVCLHAKHKGNGMWVARKVMVCE